MTMRLTDEELIHLFGEQLPNLLEERPELEPRIYYAFISTFARKEEVARILTELRNFQNETYARFDKVDDHLDRVDGSLDGVETRLDGVEGQLGSLKTRVETGFRDVQRAIDRLGGRWGIRNESVFRQTVETLLEETFGAQVEELHIDGEQLDCVIHDGDHILVEIAASVGKTIQERLERKKELYAEATGVEPSRVILATASIHSRRAQILREAGFEVIEPEEDVLDD